MKLIHNSIKVGQY